jgi:1-deoxy-D-xylulose-5-phosphate synthase
VDIGRAVARHDDAQLSSAWGNLVLLAFGSMVQTALEVSAALGAKVYDMRWIKPLDEHLLQTLASTGHRFVTLEEACVMGGAGSAVTEYLHRERFSNPVLQLGLPDAFIDHGDTSSLLKRVGLDAQGVRASIENFYGQAWQPGCNTVVLPCVGSGQCP